MQHSVGEVLFPPQIQNSLDAANAGPRVGPVVINEIRYEPKAGDAGNYRAAKFDGLGKLYDVDRQPIAGE